MGCSKCGKKNKNGVKATVRNGRRVVPTTVKKNEEVAVVDNRRIIVLNGEVFEIDNRR